MTRYDERYDEFGYEREDYDGTVQLNEYLTPREVMELLAILQNGAGRRTTSLPCRETMEGKEGRSTKTLLN